MRAITIACSFLVPAFAAFLVTGCGKSECKRYVEKFCADEKSAACSDAKARSRDWSSDKCRIERNQIEIEEQSKKLDAELK